MLWGPQGPCHRTGRVLRMLQCCEGWPATFSSCLLPFLTHLSTLTSLSKNSKPWKIIHRLAKLRSQTACLTWGRQVKDLTSVRERSFSQRRPGGVAVSQPKLTNTYSKETKCLVRNGVIRGDLYSFWTNSKCGYICYCSRINKKGEYTWTHKRQYNEHEKCNRKHS